MVFKCMQLMGAQNTSKSSFSLGFGVPVTPFYHFLTAMPCSLLGHLTQAAEAWAVWYSWAGHVGLRQCEQACFLSASVFCNRSGIPMIGKISTLKPLLVPNQSMLRGTNSVERDQ